MPRIESSLLVAALLLTGCQQQEQITAYTVPHESKADAKKAPTPSGPQRMLVAMFVRPDTIWFFRLDGPATAVTKQAETFEKLVQSVRFPGRDEPPTWAMPEGWTREPGNQFRYATLRAGALTGRVSKLDAGSPGAASVLQNVNRFRGEVGLPPTTENDLPKDTRPIEVDGVKMIWIDVSGPGGGGKGPMMKF